MEAAAKIFSLAALLYDMEIRYRFACKGFSVFSPSLDSDILSKQDTTSIVNYEKRRSKFGTFSGSAGLWCDSSIVSPLNPGICGWFGSTPFKTDSLSFQSKRPTSNIQLQYFFGFVYERSSSEGNDNKMIPYDRLLLDDCLSIAFEEGFSIEPVKVVAFLYCITAFISWVIQIERLTYSDSKIKIDWKNIEMSFRDKVIHHWNDVATLGMLRSSKKSWLDALVMHTANINKNISSIPKLDRSTLSNILDIYTWTQGDSVDDNNPRLFIKLSKDMLVLDTAWMADFLRLLLLRAGIASRESKRMGEVSGPWLECQAKSFFIRELDLENKSVVFRRIVKNKEGMEDIDIAFVVGRTLFVIDCKAMAKTADYMVGHHSILRNRKSEQLKQLIERNPARVKKIKEGLVKDKINPKEFDKSYGLVCTSDVEYLPMGEKEFWVDGFPLVAPPEELLGTIRYLHKLTNQ